MKKRLSLLLLVFALYSCASMPGIFQSDPWGSTLYGMKATYEGMVKSLGNAYLNKQITSDQLKTHMEAAQKFYESYNMTVALYEAKNLTNPEEKIAALKSALDNLQNAVQNLLIKKPAVFNGEGVYWLSPQFQDI